MRILVPFDMSVGLLGTYHSTRRFPSQSWVCSSGAGRVTLTLCSCPCDVSASAEFGESSCRNPRMVAMYDCSNRRSGRVGSLASAGLEDADEVSDVSDRDSHAATSSSCRTSPEAYRRELLCSVIESVVRMVLRQWEDGRGGGSGCDRGCQKRDGSSMRQFSAVRKKWRNRPLQPVRQNHARISVSQAQANTQLGTEPSRWLNVMRSTSSTGFVITKHAGGSDVLSAR